MSDPENGDEKLLCGTRAHMKCDVKWNSLYEAFLRRTKTFLPAYYGRIALLLGRFYHPDILVPKSGRALHEVCRRRANTFLPTYYGRIALLLGRFYHPDILVPKIGRWSAVVR